MQKTETSLQIQIDSLKEKLSKKIDCPKDEIRIVISPLRICPLGAHVDHQNGLVTGMALDEVILLAFVPHDDNKIEIGSLNFDGKVEFNLDNIPEKKEGDWGNYARGAAKALKEKYDIKKGITGLIEGKLPIGGLSSSAAVGVAYLLALETANNLDVSALENIQLDRYIENIYLGLKNGILDQSIILMSEPDKLTYLDCETVEFEKIPIFVKEDFEIIVAYSGLSKALADSSDYNNRVKECIEATKMLLEFAQKEVPENPKLRMISEEIWCRYGSKLPDKLYRRAKHFFTEVQRVVDGVDAWKDGNLEKFGNLIFESGESSVFNYESGCPHLTSLFNILKECEGVYGARFSGAGFRGSCIGLVNPKHKEEIKEKITTLYPEKHPDMADKFSIHFCKINGGAEVI